MAHAYGRGPPKDLSADGGRDSEAPSKGCSSRRGGREHGGSYCTQADLMEVGMKHGSTEDDEEMLGRVDDRFELRTNERPM